MPLCLGKTTVWTIRICRLCHRCCRWYIDACIHTLTTAGTTAVSHTHMFLIISELMWDETPRHYTHHRC